MNPNTKTILSLDLIEELNKGHTEIVDKLLVDMCPLISDMILNKSNVIIDKKDNKGYKI